MNVLRGLAILLFLQAVGEGLAHAFRLPLPGPVVGMILLTPALQFEPLRKPVRAAAEVLLANLSLLFIPVGVGVVTHLDLMFQYGIRLLIVIVVSTWVGLAVTGLLTNAMLGRSTKEEPRDE